MADESRKRQELYEAFVGGFVAPLFGAASADAAHRDGGAVAQLTRPLPPKLIEHFAFAGLGDPDVEQAMLEGLHTAASELVPTDMLRWPERGALSIAAAAHDLLVLTDPQLDRAFARGARATIGRWVDEWIDSIAMPATREQALLRHVVLDRILDLEREDTVVKNWAYTYRFYGRPPPANVVAMPRLRFVRQTHETRGLVALMTSGDERALDRRLRALLARSPITELLRPELCRPRPGMGGGFQFGHAGLAVLSDPTLRHGIVELLVKRGTHQVAQPFGHALRVLGGLGPPGEHLFVALCFLAELQLLEILDERQGHRPREEPAVGDEELFAAVLPALVDHAEAEGALGFLLELADPDLTRVVQRAEQRRRESGEDAVAFARSILDRAAPIRALSLRAADQYAPVPIEAPR
ncbi:MAG: hypothetical protein KF901_24705 [Myxococcales bacterium]|nr:hypothetical protein [Myxococcales bacterium]